jgi:hypothetical protein
MSYTDIVRQINDNAAVWGLLFMGVMALWVMALRGWDKRSFRK